jgi:transposase-like protein
MPAPREHQCPRCSSTSVAREGARSFLEVVMLLFARLRRYTCRECGEVFWDRPTRR